MILGRIVSKSVKLSSVKQIGFLLNHERFLYNVVNTLNEFSQSRVDLLGPEIAAADWAIKNNGVVRFTDTAEQEWIHDRVDLHKYAKHKIESIYFNQGSIFGEGLKYLHSLSSLKHITFHNCPYLDNNCLYNLLPVRNTLECLEIGSCPTISDIGIEHLYKLKNLKLLVLFDLPHIADGEELKRMLSRELPNCEMDIKF